MVFTLFFAYAKILRYFLMLHAATIAAMVPCGTAVATMGAANALLSPFFGFDDVSQCKADDGAQDHKDQQIFHNIPCKLVFANFLSK